jgi:hypothetical protein
MWQLRIYTLRSPEALTRYSTVHWVRHIPTFEAFGVTTEGIWTERDPAPRRLFALISYPSGADPTKLASEIMASPQFAADMKGFDPQDIVAVDTVLLDATAASPRH